MEVLLGKATANIGYFQKSSVRTDLQPSSTQRANMKCFILVGIRLIDSNLRIANVICIVNIVINVLIHTVMRPAPDVSHGDNFLFVKWGVVEYLPNSFW